MADRLRRLAVLLAYRAAGAALGVLPERVAAFLAALAGTVLARVPNEKFACRTRHIDRVLASTSPAVDPDPDVVRRWTVRSYRSYARYWMEGARVPAVRTEELQRRVILDWGYDRLEEALRSEQGVVLALPHVGSWEWGGAFLATVGHPMTTVAERVEPEALFEWFLEQRRGIGLDVLPLDDQATGRTLLQVLRRGGLVGLVCDRDLVGNGIDVEFFGERTTLPAGPATLALRTGSLLFPAAVYSGPAEHHFSVVTAPIDTTRAGTLRADVARITQELAQCFERLIQRAPEQWHLYQPNWPSDLER